MPNDYTITDMRKIKRCPKCKRYKPGSGDKCLCGYKWEPEQKRSGKPQVIYPRCKYCNALGDAGNGMCKMHFDKQSENKYLKRLEGYLKNATGTQRIPIENLISLTKFGKLKHKPEEEASDV